MAPWSLEIISSLTCEGRYRDRRRTNCRWCSGSCRRYLGWTCFAFLFLGLPGFAESDYSSESQSLSWSHSSSSGSTSRAFVKKELFMTYSILPAFRRMQGAYVERLAANTATPRVARIVRMPSNPFKDKVFRVARNSDADGE